MRGQVILQTRYLADVMRSDDDDDSDSNNKGGLGSLESLIGLTNVNVPGRARMVAEGAISETL